MADKSATTAGNVAQPFLRAGARYTMELARCILLGVVLSAVGAGVLFLVLPQGSGAMWGLGLLLSVLVFPILYAVAGQGRAIAAALTSLTESHGPMLYDQTLGRFIETMETRRPGAFAELLSSPQKLEQGFRVYLQESQAIPRVIRRVALKLVQRLSSRLVEASSSASEMVVDGRVDSAAVRAWAVEAMQDQLGPEWNGFLIVLALQVAALGAVVWMAH